MQLDYDDELFDFNTIIKLKKYIIRISIRSGNKDWGCNVTQ